MTDDTLRLLLLGSETIISIILIVLFLLSMRRRTLFTHLGTILLMLSGLILLPLWRALFLNCIESHGLAYWSMLLDSYTDNPRATFLIANVLLFVWLVLFLMDIKLVVSQQKGRFSKLLSLFESRAERSKMDGGMNTDDDRND